MNASRAVLFVAAAFGAVTGLPASVIAATPGLVVEAASGKVLFAERATEPWYPASVTKLMTAYVALDTVRQGRASMDTLLVMSPEAAAQPPSKIGLKPGMSMTLENALKIIMVKSANDIAHMIGENLGGGSVEGFAELMNAASRRLGMHGSRWVNPSGLPDDRQQSSARDMAVLARALINEFPQHEHLFRIGAVQLGRKIMRNHNGLLGRYAGADGMKTGFICSGGFNIVASATQNGRRIITVVFGYPSARERDLRTADLFDHGFANAAGMVSQRVDELPPSSVVTAQNMRPFVCGGRRPPAEEDEAAIAAAAAGDGENPIARLFAPSAFTAASSDMPSLGSRRTLGPRVAFAPIPVWTGPRQGAEPEDVEGKAKPTRLAAKPVRTKRIGPGSGEPLPVAAQGFAPTPIPAAGGEDAVDTIRSTLRPVPRAALRANLDARPAAEVKPKPGAIGPGLRAGSGTDKRNLGGIAMKPVQAEGGVSGLNPEAGGPPAGQAKKPGRSAKPETGAKLEAGQAVAAKPAAAKPAAAKPAAARPAVAKPVPAKPDAARPALSGPSPE